MRNELYFCLHLTENEHHIVEDMLINFCKGKGVKVLYYRKLKEGHIPMYREVKLIGLVGLVKPFIKEQFLDDHMEKNPHRIKRAI